LMSVSLEVPNAVGDERPLFIAHASSMHCDDSVTCIAHRTARFT